MSDGLVHISDLFGERHIAVPDTKHATERGEFLKYFASKIGKPIPYVAMRLTGIPTADLYFIQKQCDAYKGPWSKAFYGMLKVK